MAIESAANLRGLVRSGLVIALGMLSFGSAATAQKELVSTGSVIPLQINVSGPCQIYKIINAPNGDTVFLDVCGGGGYGSLYQLKKGSTTFQTIAAEIDSSGTYWNEGMAMDAKGTLYITDRYSGSQHIYRIPYNPSDGTWDYSPSGSNWEPQLAGGFGGAGTVGVAWLDNPAKDGSGILFVSNETANSILMVPVNADGTVTNFPSGSKAGQPEYQYLITGLTAKVMPMDVDVNGNLYFIENPYVGSANRATGIFFIPATAYASCLAAMKAGTSTPDTGCISGPESALQRIDPGNTEKFNGITHDAAGNIYVGDATDSYGGTRSGLLMIPNESGSPVGVTATSFNFEDAMYLAPVAVNANPAIDYRGFFWLPTGTSGNWSPAGSGQIAGTGNFVLWQPGTLNLGSTPIGTTGTPNTIFYTFSGTVTPGSIVLTQPGGGSDFIPSTTNPYPPSAGTTPAVPCTAGTTYNDYSSCQYWIALDPSGNNSVGNLQGQVSMLDSNSNVIGGSTGYLQGIGLGPASATLSPVLQTPLATSLTTPGQVAGDSLGNAYVADAGQHAVLMFPAGTTAFGGAPIGTGLTAPTGVAVDGSGDLYIADSGKVIEVPSVQGALNPAGQTTLLSGLGSNVQLAVDGGDNVYAADPSNGRVVRIFNPTASMMLEGINTVGTGFTKPTAVAVDNAGNLFVADGTNLVEINPWGGQTSITSSLVAPVTGLVVDPSGAVYVAQSGGVIRIPLESSGLNPNDAAPVDNTGVTAPTGVGMDALGNLYVTADSYNVTTINTTGTPLGPVTTNVTTPNVLMLANADVNFGVVDTATTTDPVDISVFNIGNAPLSFSATTAPSFSGTNATDYAIQEDGQNPCDTTGGTPIASGTACTLGVTVTAANNGLSQASMTFATNATNAPTNTANLEAYAENNLCRTTTTIALNPSTGVSYPGSTSISATVTAQDPTCSPGNVPTGGKISLTLQPTTKGASQIVLNSTVTNGQASFTATALNGGTYDVYASYKGDPIYGGSSSSKTYTFTVAQAASTSALAEPQGVTPINGTYYVKQGSTTTMTATVTSKQGSPTGSVTFMNGSTVLGTATLNASGTATFNTSSLAAGPSTSQLGQTYNITAVYSGDQNFAAATSPAVTIVIVPPSVLITANPATLTTKAGVAVQSTLTITPLEGYAPKPGATLYCDNSTLPQYAECTFDVPTLDIYDADAKVPGTPVTSHVTISSNLPVNVGKVDHGRSPIAFAGLFGLGLLGLAFRRRARFNSALLTVLCVAVLAGSMLGFVGCTNSGYTHTPPSPQVTTPAGTYQVSIYTVDLTNNQRSSLPFTLTLTVQQQ
ncbi:MAG TPA: Ig-like domain repeat protein [Candidatus Aquilonibacter sp.]|nr:Ig-like domain repeat protein [Candidatus Aquilonibacter sp.]